MIPVFIKYSYRYILKPFFFLLDPELVHARMTMFGELLGSIPLSRKIMAVIFSSKNPMLSQELAGVTFAEPVGLAAGFDYEARLTQITSSLGFGFHTVGSITYHAYQGNPRPMLGRLPKSRSLMVNKGFRNFGAHFTIHKLSKLTFAIPIGVSIGRTNDPNLTQQESVQDIVSSFAAFEVSDLKTNYYELNISCPNLYGSVTFYEPGKLDELLHAVDQLEVTKPIFIKMPISCSDVEIEAMLDVIVTHNIAGIIIGNLQKDRTVKSLDQKEVAKFPVGNFSGKPTFERSNELISLAYKRCGKRLIIIGCGGVFNPEDAYLKIKKGASLIQLITGMIYQGPQLIYEINNGLVELLRKEGFKTIAEAVGTFSDEDFEKEKA